MSAQLRNITSDLNYDPSSAKRMNKTGDINSYVHINEDERLNTQLKISKSNTNFNSGKKFRTQSYFHSVSQSQNLSNNSRLLGMSQFQSSNSLRNSSYVWSFSKSGRFSYKKPKTDSIYKLPDTKSERCTTQGYGERKELISSKGQNSPPPNTYQIKTCFDFNLEKKKGPLIHENIPRLPHPSAKFPGPGTYSLSKGVELSKGSPILLRSRVMFFYDIDLANKKHCISPQKYLPSTKSTENLRFTKIGFGYGGRSANENIHNLNIPGPGTYNLPSVFDKTRKSKIPLN